MQLSEADMLNWIFGPMLVTKIDRLSTYAGALAYGFVLSLIPFLVVTFSLATQLAPKKVNLAIAYRDLITDILPSVESPLPPHSSAAKSGVAPNTPLSSANAASLSTQIFTTLQSRASASRGLTTIGFILALYTSYNLMDQIVRTLLFIFDDPRKRREWNWTMVTKALALLAIWIFLLLLNSVFSIITPVFNHLLDQLGVNAHAWRAPLLIARDAVGFVALFFAFFLTYLLVPSRRHKMSVVRAGALLASLGWVVCSLVFSNVLPQMWKANAVYEALGSFVVILLWAQACAWCVIIGACWIVRFSPAKGKAPPRI